jgi:uncharacterized damage-inducible protein DinB
MIPISREQASFLLQYSLPTIKNEHQNTQAVIESIPLSNLDYRPDANSRTAMELAWHIVAAEHRFYGGIIAGAFNFSPNHRPAHVQTGPQIAQWYGESFTKNFDQITKLTGEQLIHSIDFRGMFQLPAVAYFNFSLHHTIHHRGQLTTYLRAMGGRVPAIYGESYDSAIAKTAAQA